MHQNKSLAEFSICRSAADILIHGTVSGAGAVVLSFFIHAERVPRGGTEDLVVRYIADFT